MFENLSTDIVRAQAPQTGGGDVAAMIKSALEQPLFHPPANQWLFPDDSFAIVLHSDLPQPRLIVSKMLDFLGQIDIKTIDMIIVICPQMATQFDISAEDYEQSESEIANGEPPAVIPVDVDGQSVTFQVHDPNNRNGLAYLAANEAADPVHVNRLLADADVVMPIGCPTPGGQPRRDCVYPEFGFAERREQFRLGAGSDAQREQEIELANNSLGTFFAVEFVTAPGGGIAHVVAGARKDVIETARKLSDELWTVDFLPQRETVLATIEEPGRTHTWEDFTDAVIAAANISDGSGPIVLWTSIDEVVDRKTRKALTAQFDDSISHKTSTRLRSLAAIISERPIFLKSGLSQSQTEEIGMGFISSETDVENVLSKSKTGVLLRDAHRCRVKHNTPAAS